MANDARALLSDWYGCRLESNLPEADFTVGTTAIRIAQQDPAVIARTISNNGSAAIFISSRSAVAVNAGFMLAPGNVASLTVLEDFDLAFCDLFAISGSAGNAVHVISTQLTGD